MKKIFVIIISACFIITAMTSCSKCVVCSKPSSNEVRICEKDYSSSTAYGFTLDTYKASGYSCSSSL